VGAGSGCVLLLDEPFTGQDVPLRDELIEELRSWLVLTRTPILSVTHDVGEAFQLGAEVVKIADGRVVQQGPVAEVLAAERTRLLEQLRAAAGSRA
jgi:molybdate transport system ATP-binding protein